MTILLNTKCFKGDILIKLHPKDYEGNKVFSEKKYMS